MGTSSSFDASTGLATSLPLFARYRKSGQLQAANVRIRGVRGQCTASIDLTMGKPTAVHVQDQQGQQIPMNLSTLITLDTERGPFNWQLISATQTPPDVAPQPATKQQVIPRLIAPLRMDHTPWNSQQKAIVQLIYSLIDGKRSVDEIKEAVQKRIQIPSHIIDEILHILYSMRIIEP